MDPVCVYAINNPLIIVHIMLICTQEAKFMDEVEGIDVVHSPKREEIQEICQKMCSWERSALL